MLSEENRWCSSCEAVLIYLNLFTSYTWPELNWGKHQSPGKPRVTSVFYRSAVNVGTRTNLALPANVSMCKQHHFALLYMLTVVNVQLQEELDQQALRPGAGPLSVRTAASSVRGKIVSITVLQLFRQTAVLSNCRLHTLPKTQRLILFKLKGEGSVPTSLEVFTNIFTSKKQNSILQKNHWYLLFLKLARNNWYTCIN